MTLHVMRRGAAVAAVAALLAWVGAWPVQAADGHGPYDFASGQWYADEQRAQERLGYDAYGTGRTRESRLFYPGITGAYYRGYPDAFPGTGYSYGAPAYGLMPSADYSYGAYSQSAPDNTARIRVVVPQGARVWFGSSATRQGGQVRLFESPRLKPGSEYAYDVRAEWRENGKDVTQTRHVGVRADSNTTVDFTRPEAPAQATTNTSGR